MLTEIEIITYLLFIKECDMNIDHMRQIVEHELQSFSRGTPEEVSDDLMIHLENLFGDF